MASTSKVIYPLNQALRGQQIARMALSMIDALEAHGGRPKVLRITRQHWDDLLVFNPAIGHSKRLCGVPLEIWEDGRRARL